MSIRIYVRSYKPVDIDCAGEEQEQIIEVLEQAKIYTEPEDWIIFAEEYDFEIPPLLQKIINQDINSSLIFGSFEIIEESNV